jgi:hypothetical protein
VIVTRIVLIYSEGLLQLFGDLQREGARFAAGRRQGGSEDQAAPEEGALRAR